MENLKVCRLNTPYGGTLQWQLYCGGGDSDNPDDRKK